MSNNRVIYLRTCYIKGKNANRQAVGCVALSFDRDSKQITYSVSVANPADEFRKKVARPLAIGRLTTNPMSVPFDQEISLHKITQKVMIELVNDKRVPTRARKAAKLWLNSYPLHNKTTQE